ncbi:hypothetical protein RIF29_10201 [Crotalaria pallida]|uniref:Uncharacterized protein n=1 Tax=Crotalaria pallida TaxID=3830 RepID=A0AAN9FV12_CROPI
MLEYTDSLVTVVIEGQAVVHRCKAYVHFKEEDFTPYPSVVNDNDLHLHVKRVGQLLLGSDNGHEYLH